jgi:hypothetical protein
MDDREMTDREVREGMNQMLILLEQNMSKMTDEELVEERERVLLEFKENKTDEPPLVEVMCLHMIDTEIEKREMMTAKLGT